MSFFSEPKNAGLAFIIIGVITVIGGIITVVLGAMGYEFEAGDNVYKFALGTAVAAIGTIIYGCMQFGYGKKVRDGTVSAKIDILAAFVKLVGVGTIVTGIFSAIGTVMNGDEIGTGIVSAIISIVIGLIIIWIGTKINDGKQTLGDKIIWVILLIAFILCLIAAILEIITIIGIITGICELIIYVFMLILLFDPEVKSEMGI
jgi:hypothetical protein